MEQRLQTKVTTENQKAFYQTLYNTDKTLIDLTKISADQYLLIDCCGLAYRQKYSNLNTVVLETVTTAKQFKLAREQFDYLVDNRIHNNLTWPKINTTNCAVVFDHSPIFKYLTESEIVDALEKLADRYCPVTILIQSSLFFIDDSRLKDRFYNLATIQLKNYVVEKFYYDTQTTELMMQFKIKKTHDNTN
jgi:hypothetical protein